MTDTATRTIDNAALAAEFERVVDYSEMLRLTGRRYVVLGGGRGMGRQVSHALAQLGAQVLVVDSERERAELVRDEIGEGASAHVVDATDDAQMAELAAAAGDVDGVVDVIGLARYESLLSVSEETWNWEHDVVLRHAWLALRNFGPALAARGHGSLTFVASVSGLSSAPNHGAYGVFKAGLVSMVRTAAVELGASGVRVNAVAPGFVYTPRISELVNDEMLARSTNAAPLQRLTLPRDIAGALLFLVSDLASSVSGHTLVVDAGAMAKYPYDLTGA